MTHSEFVFCLLAAFRSFNLDVLLLFSKDEKFIRSLEIAKEEFNKIYLSIKNPSKHSIESRLAKNFLEIFLPREINTIDNSLSR